MTGNPYRIVGTVADFQRLGDGDVWRCCACGCAPVMTEEKETGERYLRCITGCKNLGWLEQGE